MKANGVTDEKVALIGTVLFALAVAPFLQSVSFGPINFDDLPYALENEFVLRGLTWEGLKYAFLGTRGLDIWFPLTILSYQLDVSLIGATAQTFHASGLIWHGLATVALFVLILEVVNHRLDGLESSRGLWVAAGMAVLWAVHPQRIESVVWIASRKDSVSGFFAFLSLWAYLKARRHERSGITAKDVCTCGDRGTWLFYLLAIMGKPSVMTLPLAMACLEWLALHQISWRRLIVPTGMAAVCAGLAVFMQAEGGQVSSATFHVPIWDRTVTSLASIYYYVKTLFVPGPMAIFYPWPQKLEYGQACIGLAIVLTWAAIACHVWWSGQSKRMTTSHGWGADITSVGLWFLGMLTPILSLFMFGMHARADRFSYLPGVAVAVGGALLLMSVRRVWPVAIFILGAYLSLGGKTYCETRFWKDSIRIFERTVSVTGGNAKVYCMLACAYAVDPARVSDARAALRASVDILPNAENQGLLAFFLCMRATPAELEESVILARRALLLNPEEKPALAALGAQALRNGRWQEAETLLLRSLQNQSAVQPVILEWLGLAKFNQKKYKEALETFENAASVPGFSTPVLKERIALTKQNLQQHKEGE